jgi:hypothetical protein
LLLLGLRLGREWLLEREGDTYKSDYLHESPKGEENPEKHLDGFASKVLALELMLLSMRFCDEAGNSKGYYYLPIVF